MISNFFDFRLNESKLRTLKRTVRGSLGPTERKRFRKELRHSIITFKFRKRDGSIRLAHGTLEPSYLPALKGGAPRPDHQFVYFDVDKGEWRSFRSYEFIKIIDLKPLHSGSSSSSSSGSSKSSSSGSSSGSSKPSSPSTAPKHAKSASSEGSEFDDEMATKHKEHDVEETPRHSEHDEKHQEKKEYDVGDKIPEDELKRRSVDFRHGSRKNKFTKEANDDFKKKKDEEHHGEHHEEHHEKEKHKEEYDVGDKIPEDELKRRSVDFRHGSRKNKFTKESNDDFKKKKKDEKSKIDESLQYAQYPNVTSLGEGEFDGALWGHTFAYDGKLFYSEIGWMNMYPSYCKMTVKGDESFPKRNDIYQRKELVDLFKDEK